MIAKSYAVLREPTSGEPQFIEDFTSLPDAKLAANGMAAMRPGSRFTVYQSMFTYITGGVVEEAVT